MSTMTINASQPRLKNEKKKTLTLHPYILTDLVPVIAKRMYHEDVLRSLLDTFEFDVPLTLQELQRVDVVVGRHGRSTKGVPDLCVNVASGPKHW